MTQTTIKQGSTLFHNDLNHELLTGGPQEYFEVGNKAIWKIVKLVKILALFVSFVK